MTSTLRAVRVATLAAVLIAAVPVAAAADPPGPGEEGPLTDWGRSATQIPGSTTAGTWDGTWYYGSRDFKIAVWLRTVDGVPELKLRYFSLAIPEGFETDWNGHADYVVRDNPGRFDLRIDYRDANQIAATWDWALTAPAGTRAETAKLRIYRTGDGRFLVFHFENFKRTVDRNGKRTALEVNPAWTFEKASNRLVLWDELPF